MYILIPVKKFAAIINLIQGVLEDVGLKEESEEVIQYENELEKVVIVIYHNHALFQFFKNSI